MSIQRGVQGFSLIEAMVCCSIAAVLLAAAVPASGRLLDRQRAQGEVAQFRVHVQHARLHALGNGASVHLRFHESAAGTGYTVHQGPRDGCTLDDAGEVRCVSEAELLTAEWLPAHRGVRLHANVARMSFDSGGMTVTPTGSVSFVDRDGRGQRVVVALTGRLRTEAL